MDTIEITPENIGRWAEEIHQAAAVFDNEWDRKAVEWDGYLTTDSVVVECGSYKGRWALQIAQRYNPNLYCFEPQFWAYVVTKEVLKNHKATVFNFGLGDRYGQFPMANHGTDGCAFDENGRSIYGTLREISDGLDLAGIKGIDLMLINIEGYEYTLIPHMFDVGEFPQRLMVQCQKVTTTG